MDTNEILERKKIAAIIQSYNETELDTDRDSDPCDTCPKCNTEYENPYTQLCERCGYDAQDDTYTRQMIGEVTDDDLFDR